MCLATCGCGPAPLEPRDPDPGVFHFKIATYNVEYSDAHDESTVNAVGSTHADILCLQEVTPSWQTVIEDRYHDDYPYMLFRVTTDVSAGGLAVLAKWPLEELGFHPGPYGWHPAWHVLVTTPEGPIQLLDVHLRAILDGRSNDVQAYLEVSEDHLTEIKQFSSACDGELPTIVAGDFNETPDGSAVHFLEKHGYDNALPLFHPGQGTWRHASIADQFDKALDHILFNDFFDPLNAYVKVKGHSDHIPVIAHFQVSQNWYAAASPP